MTQVAAETVAAIVLEPVQGEGGFIVAPQAFVEGVRALCDRHGIVLVVDEVQTGFGRTGQIFAIEHYGDRARPAAASRSRSPRACRSRACSARRRSWTRPVDGGVGGTYVGNPVAQAAALAVLDVIEDERLVERVPPHRRGRFAAGCSAWQERFPQIGDVRGLGAMLAMEYVVDPATKEPAPELASRVAEEAAARGLLLLKAGIHSNCNRVLCPLVITDAELDEALDVWEEALEAARLG